MNKEDVLSKLLKRTRKENNCWLFIGCLVDGYGQLRVGNKIYFIHRLSAWIHLDYDLNDKLIQVNHKEVCNKRNCWNPEHIYLGTKLDNYRDAIKFGKHKNGIKRKIKS